MFEKAGFQELKINLMSGFFSTSFLKMNYFTLRLIKGQRLLRGLKKLFFLPFGYIGQKIAPTLDKLDKNWAAETFGYYLVEKK